MKVFYLLIFLFSKFAWAQTPSDTLKLSEGRWSVGTAYGYILYREPGLMKEYGHMYGVQGSFFHKIGPANLYFWFIKPEVEIYFGQLTYDGRYQNSGAPVQSSSDDTLYNIRVLFGYNYDLIQGLILRPYSGLGIRELQDKIIGTGGYRREINYSYLPLGIEALKEMNAEWSLSFAVEYDVLLEGSVKTYLSDVSTGSDDIVNVQKNGYGARAKFMSNHRLSENMRLRVEPYIQYWEVDTSEKIRATDGVNIYEIYEPQNDSRMYGLNLSLLF